MPKHTWATSVKTDSGSGPVDSIDLYAAGEINIAGNAVGLKGLQVGVADVELFTCTIAVANIVSFFIKSDTDVRVRINSEVSPVNEFNLVGGTAFAWNNANIPQPGLANPLTNNITGIYFYNTGKVKGVTPTAGLKIATIIGGFLISNDSVFS